MSNFNLDELDRLYAEAKEGYLGSRACFDDAAYESYPALSARLRELEEEAFRKESRHPDFIRDLEQLERALVECDSLRTELENASRNMNDLLLRLHAIADERDAVKRKRERDELRERLSVPGFKVTIEEREK